MKFLFSIGKVQVLFWIYTICILLLVALPINGDGQLLGKLNDNYVLKIRYDYLFHALLFIPWVILGGLGWDVLQRSRISTVLLFLAGLSFAIFCEYLQRLLPYRTFNINDLVSNGLGIFLGSVLLWGFGRFEKFWGRRAVNEDKFL